MDQIPPTPPSPPSPPDRAQPLFFFCVILMLNIPHVLLRALPPDPRCSLPILAKSKNHRGGGAFVCAATAMIF